MSKQPIDLHAALDTFDSLWSPRIVATINDYDVRVTKVAGDYVWHTHDTTDEFFMVLDGELGISLREDSGERAVVLKKGDVFVVPRGIEHRPSSPTGASIMVIEPAGNSTVGDRHEEVPAHIEVTTGRTLQ